MFATGFTTNTNSNLWEIYCTSPLRTPHSKTASNDANEFEVAVWNLFLIGFDLVNGKVRHLRLDFVIASTRCALRH